ncbi:MAG TPA: DUF362 domain-containing protein [Planctomycetota bacterium]|nr:DUF362 domain-containing protein [Planctomycetota bacterium]
MNVGRAQEGLNRREFLVQSAAATATLLAARGIGLAAPGGPTVVIVRDKTKKVIENFEVDAKIAQALVDKAVMTLAGKDDVTKAWAAYVRPKDKVAIKFNGLFARATTHGEVINAITDGLLKAGVEPGNIVVYDRSDGDAAKSGLKISRDPKIIQVVGTGGNLGPDVKAGSIGTKLSKHLLDADVLINVPIMKSHHRCSSTGALKNHLGSIPNAGSFHADCCAAIANLNTLGPIKEKTRLCIADALYSLYDGGPGFQPRSRFDYFGVLAATDPVAIDAVMDDILRAKREEKGLSPHNNKPIHIARAAELGLGQADLKNINRVDVEV